MPAWLAWATGLLGAWTIANGVAHNVGVWNAAQAAERAYDLRYASLVALGVSLAFAGALQVWSACAQGRAPRWPLALGAAAAVFVIAQVLVFAPILPAFGLMTLHVAWLVWATTAWRRDERGRVRGAWRGAKPPRGASVRGGSRGAKPPRGASVRGGSRGAKPPRGV